MILPRIIQIKTKNNNNKTKTQLEVLGLCYRYLIVIGLQQGSHHFDGLWFSALPFCVVPFVLSGGLYPALCFSLHFCSTVKHLLTQFTIQNEERKKKEKTRAFSGTLSSGEKRNQRYDPFEHIDELESITHGSKRKSRTIKLTNSKNMLIHI